MKQPLLTDYLSSVQYLRDLYRFRKHENSGFSFDSWAAEMGYKSRSYLKMLLSEERNITPQFIEAFARQMIFDESQLRYFSLITNYSQAENPEEKQFYLDKIFEFRGQLKDKQQVPDYHDFLSSPLVPKVFILLSFTDVNKDAASLAALLNCDIGAVENALLRLQKLQLAQPDSGAWISSQKSFKIPKNPGCKTMENYHNQCLHEAIEAQGAPLDLRRFRSIMLPLSAEDYTSLLDEVQALVTKAVAKYDSDTLNGKRLYKMNLNLFPVTELHSNQEVAQISLNNVDFSSPKT